MKAIVHDRHGPPDVLHLEEVEQPVPKPDEIQQKTGNAVLTVGGGS